MALEREIARQSKILVDAEGISFEDAQDRLRRLTVEIVVGPDAVSAAEQVGVLTAVSVGTRSFLGGVRLVCAADIPLNVPLPVNTNTLMAAARATGASEYEGTPAYRIIFGHSQKTDAVPTCYAWWEGWRAGVRSTPHPSDDIKNPLAALAAGAHAVGTAFQAMCGRKAELPADIDLWATEDAPSFGEVFLPAALWLVGLGNLGQSFLWALSCLPYADPTQVHLVLQDLDHVSPENWGTSVLVTNETFDDLKTKVAEIWADRRGFKVRRIDRRLKSVDRWEDGDPIIALSGLDKIEPRIDMAEFGFAAIVDAGLGRTARDFDKFRVNVFSPERRIDTYFADQKDAPLPSPESDVFERLEAELGRCGAAEIVGANVAVPYVSAIASAVAISRVIALASACEYPPGMARCLSKEPRPITSSVLSSIRGLLHAGRPLVRI